MHLTQTRTLSTHSTQRSHSSISHSTVHTKLEPPILHTSAAMDMGNENSSSSSSASASSSPEHKTVWPSPPKRPAGRTKFRETRHPVFRGVRRRGSAGRWVCELRVPGKRGARLWLGTYVTAEAAARAHDAAMLALRGRSTVCLNFPDSAWLLAVPPALSDLADVRRAAVEAVADFLLRKAANGSAAAAAIDEATSSVSAPLLADNAGSSATSGDPSSATLDVPATLDSDMFEFDLFGEMDLDMYYASLAQGLLMEPPPAAATGAYWDNGDCGDGGPADVALWSY